MYCLQDFLILFLILANIASSSLVSSLGDKAIIPGWHLQSSLKAMKDLVAVSQPGFDVSSWYPISSKATVMAGLIENDVYNDRDLFYSNNLEKIDQSIFKSPWLYREEFSAKPGKGHIFIDTHGISSKADIYLNGHRIADANYQDGSYTGHRYDVTPFTQPGRNCLLIHVYPTNYLRDLALGFADWNPYPPDNGTGVWREVEVSMTGPVSISDPRVVTDFSINSKRVTVTVKADITNNEKRPIRGTVNGTIHSDDGQIPISQTFELKPREAKTISMKGDIVNAKVWWPAQWGSQPLYTAQMNARVEGTVSDISRPKSFGIRQATSHVNSYNDTEFTINGHPFLVLGAGYSPDLFLRFDIERIRSIFQYMLDMGLNTVRLEGKMEHPEFYELADKMGLMVIAGWECCDKWEGWEYNEDAGGYKWTDDDYTIANYTMLHEASMLQSHPSLLAFLVGSDYWPNDRATNVYVNALQRMDWPNPTIASASKRGYADPLGPSGMKMEGPYDWVPPNYWYGDQLGAAFGFGSEQGAGVGTPEIDSLKRFMDTDEMDALWKDPIKGQYHMSQNYSQFYDRAIYNEALFKRYGPPKDLEDYIFRAQMMDYEATRAEFEAFSIRQNASHPATGVIYWMLNSAWPNLHWQLFDYYLRPMGAYFGVQTGARNENAAYDYQGQVWLINRGLQKGKRVVTMDLMDLNGKSLGQKTAIVDIVPNSSKAVFNVPGLHQIKDVAFLRIILQDTVTGKVLSRNVYWLSKQQDTLDWDNSTWYHTPVTTFSDFSALENIAPSSINATVLKLKKQGGETKAKIQLESTSKNPAFFIRLTAQNQGKDISPVFWSDNYVTLFASDSLTISVRYKGEGQVRISGKNIQTTFLNL